MSGAGRPAPAGSPNLVHGLPLRDADGHYRVVVEVTRGSQVKLKYDAELGVFVWSRELVRGVAFPYDFGFFPRTHAEDGDPLDALVFAEQSSYPGVVATVRVIGALRVEQRRDGGPVRRNDRILVVPVNGHRSDGWVDVRELPERVHRELEAFFRSSLALTGKQIFYRGWAGAEEATGLVDAAAEQYRVGRAPARRARAAPRRGTPRRR